MEDKPSGKGSELITEAGRILDALSRFGPACEQRALEKVRRSVVEEVDQLVSEIQMGKRQWQIELDEKLFPGPHKPWVRAIPPQDSGDEYMVLPTDFHDGLPTRTREKVVREEWKSKRVVNLPLDNFLKVAVELKSAVLSGQEDQNLSRGVKALTYTHMATFLTRAR